MQPSCRDEQPCVCPDRDTLPPAADRWLPHRSLVGIATVSEPTHR
jgi:hypothetical protein